MNVLLQKIRFDQAQNEPSKVVRMTAAREPCFFSRFCAWERLVSAWRDEVEVHSVDPDGAATERQADCRNTDVFRILELDIKLLSWSGAFLASGKPHLQNHLGVHFVERCK